jgi:hypothetical protein
MSTESAPDLYVITHTEMERIESMLMMANLAISEIIANGRVKRLPPSRRSNARQTHLNEASDRTIWECCKVDNDELF